MLTLGTPLILIVLVAYLATSSIIALRRATDLGWQPLSKADYVASLILLCVFLGLAVAASRYLATLLWVGIVGAGMMQVAMSALLLFMPGRRTAMSLSSPSLVT